MRLKELKIIAVFVVALMAGCLGVMAETVSQKMASRIAQTFFNTMYGETTPRPKLVWNGRELTTNRLFTPFYVYNSPRGGYVAVSAESKAYPVLAYSRKENFDRSHLGEAEREQFTRYAREIELIRYDSRIPTGAKQAWEKLPEYLTQVINNPYNTDEYRLLTTDAQDQLEQMDRRNAWILMPSAIEFNLYDPERYRDYTLEDALGEEEEYVPFKFYEDFISDIQEEERARAARYEKILYPTEPIVQYLGGSHYTIHLTEEAKLMRVYSVAGARMQEKYFTGSNTMNIDLSGMTAGYYIILALDQKGNIYAFKVHR